MIFVVLSCFSRSVALSFFQSPTQCLIRKQFQKNERRNALERDYMKRNSKNELQRFHIHPFAQLSRSFASEKKSGKKIGDFEWGDTVDGQYS